MSREVERQSAINVAQDRIIKRLGRRVVGLKSGFYANDEVSCSVNVTRTADLRHHRFDVVGILPAVSRFDYNGLHSVVQMDYPGYELDLDSITPDITLHWELPSRDDELKRRVYPVSEVCRTKYGGMFMVHRAIVAAETVQGFFPKNLRAQGI